MSVDPRVFVSSVIDGYEEFREAARRGIVQAGGEPVLIEDQPSLATSPRTACLNLVGSCDALICIVGERGGFRAPSGRLVVQEELEEAVARGIPTVAFLQDTSRDDLAAQLARDLSDWVAGRLRRTFSSPSELEKAVQDSLAPALDGLRLPRHDPALTRDLLVEPTHGAGQYETVLRIVFSPTQQGEVFDPLFFDVPETRRAVQRDLHESHVFDYRVGSEESAASTHLTIVQACERGANGAYAAVRIYSDGRVLIESQASNRHESFSRDLSMSAMFELPRSDLEAIATAGFDFMNRLLDRNDPYGRYSTWEYNACLVAPGSRRVVPKPSVGRRSYSAGGRDVEMITACDSFRALNRAGLSEPDSEVERLLQMLTKRLEEARGI